MYSGCCTFIKQSYEPIKANHQSARTISNSVGFSGYPVASPWPIGKKVSQPRSTQIIRGYKKRVMFSGSQIFSASHSAKSFRSTFRSTTSYLSPRTLQRHLPIVIYSRQITIMSSATSFFDFEPVDSMYTPRGVPTYLLPSL